MRLLLAVAAIAALPPIGTAAAACGGGRVRACRHAEPTMLNLNLNLNLSPEIAKKVVAGEPLAKTPARSQHAPGDSTPYTGPAFHLPTIGRGAVVGYHWSTD